MKVQLKETVVRWKIVDVDDVSEDMSPAEIEENSFAVFFEEIQEEGFDGEEVLAQDYTILED